MTSLAADVRFAIRRLTRDRAFTLLTVLTLALGIGATSTIFAVAYGVLFRDLPFQAAERIVAVTRVTERSDRDSHSPADYLDVAREQRVFAALAAYRQDALDFASGAGDPERITGAEVTSAFFDVFGVPAAAGRTLSGSGDAMGGERLIVLGHGLWQRRFASDPRVVGQSIRVNRELHTVVGVMPPSFAFPDKAEAWTLASGPVPTSLFDVDGDLRAVRDTHYFEAVARVAPGVTVEQARAWVSGLGRDLARRYPDSNANTGLTVLPLRHLLTRDLRAGLLMLLAAVGVLLVMACVNIAGVLLSRIAARARELAIRAAMGAGRRRLVQQLLVESLVLGVAGSLSGLLLASWGIGSLSAVLSDSIPRTGEIRLDFTVTLFALGLGLATAVLTGIVPAWLASQTDLTGALRAGDRHAASGRPGRAMSVLVVVEVALGVVLTVAAGLLMNSLLRLQAVDPGYRTDQVYRASLPLPRSRYATEAQQADFYGRLLERLASDPRTRLAAAAFPLPLSGARASTEVAVEGRPVPPGATKPVVGLTWVSPGYFRALGIPVHRGRDFDGRDRSGMPFVAVVSAAAAELLWPGVDPVGRRADLGDAGAPRWCTVVGVVGNVRNRSLAEPPGPMIYFPLAQSSIPLMSLVVRSEAGVGPVASAVRAAVREIDPDLPVGTVGPLVDVLDRATSGPRQRAVLLALFASAAMLLAALGVYGVLSYSVARRTREIGIRLAMGALPGQVVGGIVRDGLRLSGLGIAAGLLASVGMARVIGSLLYGVTATDPATLCGVAALLAVTAVAACWFPARRARRIDPIEALRAE